MEDRQNLGLALFVIKVGNQLKLPEFHCSVTSAWHQATLKLYLIPRKLIKKLAEMKQQKNKHEIDCADNRQ